MDSERLDDTFAALADPTRSNRIAPSTSKRPIFASSSRDQREGANALQRRAFDTAS